MNVWLLLPDRNADLEAPLPPQSEALAQDLNLPILLRAMAQGDRFLYEVSQHVLLSSLESVEEIRYRQDILRDCLAYPQIIRELYQIPLEAIARKQRHWLGIFTRTPGAILSGGVQMLTTYFDLLKDLRRLADVHGEKFTSPGLRRFFAMIRQELDDAYLNEVADHLNELRFREGMLVSAELGPGCEGRNYVLRRAQRGSWLRRLVQRATGVYWYTLAPRDDHGARALGELRERGLQRAAAAVGQAAEHVDSFFTVLRRELAFYIAALNLHEQLSALGLPTALPEIAPPRRGHWSARGLYDAALALTAKRPPVGNDLEADGKELLIITGANQGGKSTFLRSLGLAQIMAQCGLFVPAQAFSAGLARGVFTHFRREEDTSMTSGKLDEELSRMSQIADQLRTGALMLFNESFAATNEREGAEIARQVVDALLERGVRVAFVTHQYELAHGYHARNLLNVLFLRADRKRDFKIRIGAPLPTSHGEDLYRKVFSLKS